MSEWNYTKCSKPFESVEDALEFMVSRSFEGQVLQRTHGYTAVCPTYPDGYYPDATPVASYSPENGIVKNKEKINLILNVNQSPTVDTDCCPQQVNTVNKDKCC